MATQLENGNTLRDYVGTPIVAGSHIVWPVRRKSELYLRRGHVTEITSKQVLLVNAADGIRNTPGYKTYRTRVYTPRRCAVVG